MDLKGFSVVKKSEEGVWIEEFYGPNDELLEGVRIKVVGKHSKKNKAYTTKLGALYADIKNIRSAKEASEVSDDMYVGCIVEWEGIEWNGEPMECTDVNIRKIFSEVPCIKDQVVSFILDDANFLEG